jgi:hypothetical protein
VDDVRLDLDPLFWIEAAFGNRQKAQFLLGNQRLGGAGGILEGPSRDLDQPFRGLFRQHRGLVRLQNEFEELLDVLDLRCVLRLDCLKRRLVILVPIGQQVINLLAVAVELQLLANVWKRYSSGQVAMGKASLL